MRDIELYRHLLGLETPWSVKDVRLDVKTQRVDVWVEHPEGVQWPCPECGGALPLYDHSEERVWRHLDSCQFMTYLHARPPRVDCPDHKVRQVKLPWAEPMSRFTSLFERLAIDVLKETDVSGATRILRMSWDEAWHVMERAVARGLAAKEKRAIPRLGVDEKAIAHGHRYMTLVYDLDRSTVEYIEEDRRKESLERYFQGLSQEELDGIRAVAMDMWEPYVQAVLGNVPGGADKIVFDRYHIMGHMGKAVDEVRKRESRDLMESGDNRLKGTKYLWLYSRENLPERHQDRFSLLQALHLKTARAWAIKECLRALWTYRSRPWALRFWKGWYGWAIRSRLKPVIRVARMIRERLHNVLTYCEHAITNAVSEGINSKIQTIQKMACGFRNRDNFKTAVFFHCGGLQLYPSTHAIPG